MSKLSSWGGSYRGGSVIATPSRHVVNRRIAFFWLRAPIGRRTIRPTVRFERLILPRQLFATTTVTAEAIVRSATVTAVANVRAVTVGVSAAASYVSTVSSGDTEALDDTAVGPGTNSRSTDAPPKRRPWWFPTIPVAPPLFVTR
jgi:hypothetical protein